MNEYPLVWFEPPNCLNCSLLLHLFLIPSPWFFNEPVGDLPHSNSPIRINELEDWRDPKALIVIGCGHSACPNTRIVVVDNIGPDSTDFQESSSK